MSRRFPRGLEMLPANVEAASLIGVDAGAAIRVGDPSYKIEQHTLSSLDAHRQLAESHGVQDGLADRDKVVLAKAIHPSIGTQRDILAIRGWSDGIARHLTGFAVCAPTRGMFECLSPCLLVSEHSDGPGQYDLIVLRSGDRVCLPNGSFGVLALDPAAAAVLHLPAGDDDDDRLRFLDDLPPLIVEAEPGQRHIRILKTMDGKLQPILNVVDESGAGLAEALIERLSDTSMADELAAHGIHVRHGDHDLAVESEGRRVFLSHSLGDWSQPTRVPQGGQESRSRFLERWERLQKEKTRLADTLGPIIGRPVKVVIEGPGHWVVDAYRPALEEIKKKHELLVTYVHEGTTRVTDLAHWEHEIDKRKDSKRYDKLEADFVFVSTPDETHCQVAKVWLERRQASLIFIEKPFDSSLEQVQDLIRAHAVSPECNIFGMDHYLMYERPLRHHLPAVIEALGGAITEVDFFLCEAKDDAERLATLQYGMTLDLLPHLLALLEKYTDLGTLDDIVIDERSQYDSIPFANETFSRTRFTAGWPGEDDTRFDCRATVGKGLREDVKYIELRGVNGRVLWIDFKGDFPRGSIFIRPADGEAGTEVAHPYHLNQKLHMMAPSVLGHRGWLETPKPEFRYLPFLTGLIEGSASEAVTSTLLMADAANLVSFLGRLRTFMTGAVMNQYTIGVKSVP